MFKSKIENTIFKTLLLTGLLLLLHPTVSLSNGSGFAGGDGQTPATAYQISTWDHLNNIRNSSPSAYYVLINNLDENTIGYQTHASSTANGGRGWIPVRFPANDFEGQLSGSDGNGGRYTIKDLYMNNSNHGQRTGFFAGAGSGAVIKNLIYENATVIGNSSHIAVVVGFASGGITFDNISVTGSSVTGNTNNAVYMGGILGSGNWGTIISNSSFSGSVTGREYIGGLVGAVFGEISNSNMSGTITASLGSAGGIVGYLSAGTVTLSHSNATVIAKRRAGGLVGDTSFQEPQTITKSYSTGDVLVTDEYDSGSYAGGIVGYANMTTIREVFTTGTITGAERIGGVVGEMHGNSTLRKAFATGTVLGNENSFGIASVNSGSVDSVYFAGEIKFKNPSPFTGVVEALTNGTLTAGYWNSDTEGQTSSKGTPLTLEQFRYQANFSAFDFSSTGPWTIVEGRSFPHFKEFSTTLPPGFEYDFQITSALSKNFLIADDGETFSTTLTLSNTGGDDFINDVTVTFSSQNATNLSFSGGTVSSSVWTLSDFDSGTTHTLTISGEKTGNENGVLAALIEYKNAKNETVSTTEKLVLGADAYGAGKSLAFDGTNTWLESEADATDAGLVNSDFTIEVWIKPEETNGDRMVIAQNSAPDEANKKLHAGIRNGNLLFGFFYDDAFGNTPIQTNEWQHVAFVFNASTKLQSIYVNGQLDASRTADAAFTGETALTIGNFGGAKFQGEMDELRIWNKALTQSEVRKHMHTVIGSESQEFQDLTLYHRFDAGTDSLVYDYTGSHKAINQSETPQFVDVSGAKIGNTSVLATSSSAKTIGVAGDQLSVSNVSADAVALSLKGAAGNEVRTGAMDGESFSSQLTGKTNERLNTTFGIYPKSQNSITADLVFSYGEAVTQNKLTEPVQVIYRTSPDHDWQPAVGWTKNLSQKTLSKSGEIKAGEYSFASFSLSNVSFEMAIESLGVPEQDDFSIKLSVSNNGPDPTQNTSVELTIPTGSGIQNLSSSSGSFNAGTMTWNIGALAVGAESEIVVAGKLSGLAAAQIQAAISDDQIVLGSESGQLTKSLVLSSAPYASGSALQINSEITTGQSATNFGLVDESFTVEAWIKPVNLSGDKSIIGQSGSAANKTLHFIIRNGKLLMGFFANDLEGTSTLKTHEWYHVAFTYDRATGDRKIFLNGELDGNNVASTPFTGTGALSIGVWNGGGVFEGEMDELRFWEDALTQEQIRDRMHQTIEPNEPEFADLKAYYRFDEGAGSTLNEIKSGLNGTITGTPAWITASEAPLGQKSVFVNNASADSTGEKNASLRVENLNGGAVTIYSYGSFGNEQLNPTGDLNGQINKISPLSWNIIKENDQAVTADLSIHYGAADSAGYSNLPVLLYRADKTQPWALVNSWEQNYFEKTFSFSGAVEEGEYRLGIPPVLTTAIPNAAKGWRMIGAPGNFARYGDVLQNVWTQGYPNAGNNPTSSDANVFYYDEPTRSWKKPGDANNLVGTAQNTSVSTAGKAMLVYFYENNQNQSLTYSGIQSAGDVTVNLTNTVTDPSDDMQGWHLVSNPYPFAIDWRKVVADGLNEVTQVIFVFDGSAFDGNGGYRVHYGYDVPNLPGSVSHNAIIPPFQGFWVRTAQSDGTAGVLTFKETHAANEGDTGTLYKSNGEEQEENVTPAISFSVKKTESDHGATTLIQFEESEGKSDKKFIFSPASLTQDVVRFGWAAQKHQPAVSASVNGKTPVSEQLDLMFGALKSGEYELSISEIALENIRAEILLTDHKTGESMLLKANESYLFTHQATETAKKSTSPKTNPFGNTLTSVDVETRFSVEIVTEMITSAEEVIELPEKLELSQNYPNPFNPSTQIQFALPESREITLEVFDVMGRKVQTLISRKQMNAGKHDVVLDGAGLSSGIYIYRLQAGMSVLTRKMTLIK